MVGEFGLEATVMAPPGSAFVSILMIAGVQSLGAILVRGGASGPHADAGWRPFIAPAAGSALLAGLLYPLMLFGQLGARSLPVIAWSLAILGTGASGRFALRIWRRRADAREWAASMTSPQSAPAWILLGLALLALGPSTNADSLNYHLGVALRFLHDGAWPVEPEWFHSRLAGAGEALIALGLSVGAEQFASLLQWCGIACIFGLITRFPARDAAMLRWLALAFMSAPVLLFLVSSDKPQALPVAMTSAALALTLYPQHGMGRRDRLLGFALVCLLLTTAAQMKLNFMISAAVVGLIAFALLFRRDLGVPAFAIAAAVIVLVVLPPAWWRHVHFGGAWIDAFVKPFPGNWPGYDNFTKYLREYRDSPMAFPLSLLIPASVGVISTVMGVGVAVLIWLRPERDNHARTAIAAAAIVTLLGVLLGQGNARFFLEPFVWLLMAVCLQPPAMSLKAHGAIRLVLSAQALLAAALIGVGVVRALPAAVSATQREAIMAAQADGYSIMRWVAEAAPADAVLISDHSSLALSPRRSFATDWVHFVGEDPSEWAPYLQLLRVGRVTYMLVVGSPELSPFQACFSGVQAGPLTARKATRNPLNAGTPYSARIMKFDADRLPGCFKK